MKAQWLLLGAKLSAKIDALSLRERALVLFSVIALVYMMWNVVFLSPQEKNYGHLSSQMVSIETQLKGKQSELALFTDLANNKQSRPIEVRQRELKLELESLNAELATLSQGLIAARDLPALLQRVLIKSKDLRLLSAQTLPVESIILQAEGTSGDSSGLDESNGTESSLEAGVYKHATALKISGGYFQVLDYLRTLESLPWRFYWDWMNYSVVDYPNAEIEIRVYTLSAEEGLLGV